jgi:putative transcriptional regulator
MPIKYDKLLALLEQQGYTTYKIRKDNIMSQSAWQKIRTGTGDIDTRTIAKLCRILGVQPGDIMEYVPDQYDSEHAEDDLEAILEVNK